MAASSYRADISKDFDVARQRAAQSENRQMQSQRDALTRRQAQMGGGPGGAFVKAEQQAQGESAQRLAQANEGIDVQQRQEVRRLGEIDEARAYQTSERQGAEKFSAGQAEAQRKWASGERMSAQDWQALEAGKQRTWGTSEREAGQTFQAGESNKTIDAQFRLQEEQIKAAAAQGQITKEIEAAKLAELKRQYDEDTKVNASVNAISTLLSGHNSGIKPEQMAQLLKQLGIDVGPGIPGFTAPMTPQSPDAAAAAAPAQATYDYTMRYGTPEEKRAAIERRRMGGY